MSNITILPRDRGWASGLADVIREYSAGRQRKKLTDLEEALNEARITQMTARGAPKQFPQDWTEAQLSAHGMSEKELAAFNLEKTLATLANWGRQDTAAYKMIEARVNQLKGEIETEGGMEVTGEPAEKRYRGTSLPLIGGKNWLTDILARDKPSTLQVKPRGGIYPQPAPSTPTPQQKISPEILAPLLKGRDVPPEYQKLGVDRYRPPTGVDIPLRPKAPSPLSIPEEVDELIRSRKAGVGSLARPQPQTRKQPGLLSRQGMGEIAGGIKSLFTGAHKGREGVKQPPEPPKEKAEYEAYNKVRAIWYRMPTSIQLDIWAALEAGVSWPEILGSSDVQKYMKNADTNTTNRR